MSPAELPGPALRTRRWGASWPARSQPNPRSTEPENLFRTRCSDVLAGLAGAIGDVPNGMASALLVAVNPVHGLYAGVAGPIAGGVLSGTGRMVVTTTTASALAAGSALDQVAPADRAAALVLLTLLTGVALTVAGLYRLARYTRFVSHSVMTGFLTGIAVNIVLAQLPQLAGRPGGAGQLLQHPGDVEPVSAATGLAAVVLLVVLRRTPLAAGATLAAVVLPTVAVTLAGADVATVADVGSFPTGLPVPDWPGLDTFSPALVTGALAVAAIVLVQGAGVGESAAAADRHAPDPNRDLVAQGAGNLASALIGGQPVGGSLGQTALNVASGARSRWAAVSSGVWMLLIVSLLSDLVGRVAMPTLSAVLVVAALGSMPVGRIRDVLGAGIISRVALVTTFGATLLLPVPQAVGLGVALSLLLQLNQEALDLRLVRLVPAGAGRLREVPVPAVLPDREVTIIDVHGSLFHAGAGTFQARLPDPAPSRRPAVVLRLRGHRTLGTTFVAVLVRYRQRLDPVQGRLYLSGVGPEVAATLADRAALAGSVVVYRATDLVGESTLAAARDAADWTTATR
jgi:SulP family sulfate permease